MKQTNNAIKFLMAQYRAIFKNAYFKGMATALVLTAGLAAGQAQAASATDPFYQQNGTWSERTSWNTSTAQGMTAVAGDYDDGTTAEHNDGTVSGETLVIGSSGSSVNGHPADIGSITSGSAYGGFVSITSGEKDSTASGNKAFVTSGGTINTSDNLVGGWAKTNGTGFAQALNNELHIDAGATITKANTFAGGVAATFEEGSSVSHSFAIGNVTVNNAEHVLAGGFVGSAVPSILDCYSGGTVSAKGANLSIGGFIGNIANDGYVTNSYSYGYVLGTGTSSTIKGAFIGNEHTDKSVLTIKNSYFDSTVNTGLPASGNNPNSSVIAKSTTELYQTPSSRVYTQWSTDNWCFNCSAYPVPDRLLKTIPYLIRNRIPVAGSRRLGQIS